MGSVEHLHPDAAKPGAAKLSETMRSYLARGLSQPGGKLPLFDEDGQKVNERTVRSCLDRGLVEPWFINPLKPDFLVCRLTVAGYDALGARRPRR